MTAKDVRDPTGCGDAYRAGILYGLLNEMSWADTGRLAAVLGATKIATPISIPIVARPKP